MEPYKYKSVLEEEVHPDYSNHGVAGLIGRHLNDIAQEDSDRGALAEGILRSGDHNMLPILNDKLAGDDYIGPHTHHTEYDAAGNMLSGPIDWHHAPRAIAIDKAVHDVLANGKAKFGNSVISLSPVDPKNVINSWSAGNFVFPSRKHLLSTAQEVVPDATIHDLYHSLFRLTIPEKGAAAHTDEHGEQMNRSVKSISASNVINPHKYQDTRPAGKRNVYLYKSEKEKSKQWIGKKIKLLMSEGYPQKQAIAIALSMAGKTKYSSTKAGAAGMVDQISPLAAFGVWRKPGEFSTSLEYEPDKNKKLGQDQFQPSNTKPLPPAKPFDNQQTQRKLSVEYIRKLAVRLKRFKASKKDN